MSLAYLVIYDTTGKIIAGPMNGSVQEPTGIPFMWVEIPEGKTLKSIDISKNPHEPIFEDKAPREIDLINEQLQEINNRMFISEELNYTAMEAVVSIYEAVYPFLPQ